MALKDKVMISRLTISQWSGRKYDPTVSKEVELNHNASNAGRFNKLLINNENLKKISRIANMIRAFHYNNTLPWEDNGDRLLPVDNYFKYVGEIGKLTTQFDTAVSKFVRNYESMIDDAKIRLGTMFKLTDYPTSQSIKDKFAVSTSFDPVSDAGDFRVNLNEEEVDKIKAEITASLDNKVKDAVNDLIARIKGAVKHMANALADPDAVFRDSMCSNVKNLTELLPRLNFNDDERVNELIAQIRPLSGCEPKELRTDKKYRKRIAGIAQGICDEIESKGLKFLTIETA